MQAKARITGLGSYLPDRILTNQELEKMVETSDEWIVSRTGIKERRIANDDETPSFMGAQAAVKALEASGLDPQDIDMILVATMTPDYQTPSTGALIQAVLGAPKAAAIDLQAACSGYLYGLSMAKAYVDSEQYNNVLLVATEKLSSIIDYQDRNTCILFGDGASAAVISNQGKGFLIDTVCLGADGTVADTMVIPAGGARCPFSSETLGRRDHYLKMEGKAVFKHAIRRMSAAIEECLIKAHLGVEQISWLVPHQANIRIIDALSEYTHVPQERVFKTVHKYGNTSASSVAIALDELNRSQNIKLGENLLLVAFGAGLTWGTCILTQVSE